MRNNTESLEGLLPTDGEDSDKKHLHCPKQLPFVAAATLPAPTSGYLQARREFELVRNPKSLSTRSSRTPPHLVAARARAGSRQRPNWLAPNALPQWNSLETDLMTAAQQAARRWRIRTSRLDSEGARIRG